MPANHWSDSCACNEGLEKRVPDPHADEGRRSIAEYASQQRRKDLVKHEKEKHEQTRK